jgi:hypothetical protein
MHRIFWICTTFLIKFRKWKLKLGTSISNPPPPMKLIISQNYFTFQKKIYQPDKGVSMGSPIFSTIAKIFLQHLEDIHIKQLLDTKNITFYTIRASSWFYYKDKDLSNNISFLWPCKFTG